jgi:hypothetical protein
VALREARQGNSAIKSIERSLLIAPNVASARLSLAFAYLSEGHFEAGWQAYECRFAAEAINLPDTWPTWEGYDVTGKSLIVFGEGGLGDTIQFSRYGLVLASLGAKVTMVVQRPLRELLARSFPDIEILDAASAERSFDAMITAMSIPRVLKTTLHSIPCHIPYIFPDSDRVTDWGQYLGRRKIRRIGLAWAGNPQNRNDGARSIRLEQFAPLFANHQLEFHCLHASLSAADQQAATQFPNLMVHPPERMDFPGTAALMMELDLIISVDSSMIHLAGALGRPAWLLLSTASDWRWLTARDDNPWYPTIRIFRQLTYRDWGPVISQIESELSAGMIDA